jgi:transposase
MAAMDSGAKTRPLSVDEYAAVVVERDRLSEENRHLHERLASVQHDLDWLKRQLFGEKSERRLLDVPPEQMSLGEGLERTDEPLPPAQQKIPAHTRSAPQDKPFEGEDESALFFDDSVPVQIIEVPNPETEGLAEDAYEVIGEKLSHRLAQRPGSCVFRTIVNTHSVSS